MGCTHRRLWPILEAMQAGISGTSVLLGVLLVVAGMLKLMDPRPFGWAMMRLMPAQWWGWRVAPPSRIGRIVGPSEVAIGVGVVLLPGAAGAAMAGIAGLLFLGFTAAVLAAIRKGSSCGCWGSFSDGPAGGAELGRVVALAIVAVALAVSRPLSGDNVQLSWPALVWALVLLACVGVAARAGGIVMPARSKSEPSGALGSSWRLVRGAVLMAGLVGHRIGNRPLPRSAPPRPSPRSAPAGSTP
jgi:hypothetical protein